MITIDDIKTLNPELNAILKEMWRIDKKINEQEVLSDEEQAFYDQHLETIVQYYIKSSEYWNSRSKLV
ncbi:MAG TPA: hypothetical protein VGE63_03480 [Candidatus Paceibacterota bacterium]